MAPYYMHRLNQRRMGRPGALAKTPACTTGCCEVEPEEVVGLQFGDIMESLRDGAPRGSLREY